jgi:hypothetical protein
VLSISAGHFEIIDSAFQWDLAILFAAKYLLIKILQPLDQNANFFANRRIANTRALLFDDSSIR